jgi:exodeoxyribonuclease VII large subunit
MFEDLELFAPLAQTPRPLSVCELNGLILELLEGSFPRVWVAGELSRVQYASSGHVYFNLKDEEAVIDAVLWRTTASKVRFRLEQGLSVLVRGRISVYVPRGKYQIVVEEIEPQGQGALELAYQQLKAKLEARGWFDPSRKKPLPLLPQRIALVTSPTGAVVRDMLRILRRRWPLTEVWVCPVPVQGQEAAPRIAAMIELLNQLDHPPDLMIVGRGGGSLEDLWAFNEEMVAAAMASSHIPIISAVGHETDFTIADYVADRRAATPSEAAEMAVPDRYELLAQLENLRQRLPRRLQELCRTARQRLDSMAKRRVFTHPLEHFRALAQTLDTLADRADRALQQVVKEKRLQVESLAAQLTLLNPLQVLARGYSLTQDQATGRCLTDAATVQPGQTIVTQLHRGRLRSRVEQIEPEAHRDEGREDRTDL